MASRPKKAVKKASRPAATKAAPAPADAALLLRIADALERLAPPRAPDWDETAADAFVWHAEPLPGWLEAVPQVNAVSIDLLQGVDRVRDILLDNTTRFARGLPANNALLWGARGMGKSSLVKAAIGAINGKKAPGKVGALALVEIHREDIPSLPMLLRLLRKSNRRYVLFCDDLSFDAEDQHYKSLKAVLDGGIEGRPDNVILYATSNRRHLLPRDMMENERSTAINPHEAVEEKVSLSDRFGLWLGFHSCSQEDFFAMLDGYCAAYGLKIDQAQLRAEAVEWSMTRGARSGRVAWQFIQDLAGRLGKPLKPAK
jgi:predicted AAA+ superfamily ATPase